MKDCLFCKIVAGEVSSHKVWEDKYHLAFLTIFPNTPGFTVVITKKHYPSYLFNLDEGVYQNLLKAAKTVGKVIDARLADVERTGLMAEGTGVDHAHVKLFPMHGYGSEDWEPEHINTYFEKYPGYISSHDSERADDEELAALAKSIRE